MKPSLSAFLTLREILIHFIAFQNHARYLQDVGCFV